jgi:hypothetical protein
VTHALGFVVQGVDDRGRAARVTELFQEANRQLARIDTITSDVAEVTGNASALVSLIAATVGGPLIRIAGFSAAVRAAIVGGRFAKNATK